METIQDLANKSVLIWVEPRMFSILGQSNVGLGACGIKVGGNQYTQEDAIRIIEKIDHMMLSAPKHLKKRIWATRMSFVFAFGPELEEKLRNPLCIMEEKR